MYLHCTSGISRAPALAVTYLCLFKKVKVWRSAEDVYKLVKQFHPNSCVNLRVVASTVQDNQEFQA